jgi:hypothetical protein
MSAQGRTRSSGQRFRWTAIAKDQRVGAGSEGDFEFGDNLNQPIGDLPAAIDCASKVPLSGGPRATARWRFDKKCFLKIGI